ncbi:hypothetical protein, partial [Thermogutta sp.]|uniref:hypothetical protein n=1 Tax=Thermogutta sp. TaxID=1962930 RepID=UPI00321F7968
MMAPARETVLAPCDKEGFIWGAILPTGLGTVSLTLLAAALFPERILPALSVALAVGLWWSEELLAVSEQVAVTALLGYPVLAVIARLMALRVFRFSQGNGLVERRLNLWRSVLLATFVTINLQFHARVLEFFHEVALCLKKGLLWPWGYVLGLARSFGSIGEGVFWADPLVFLVGLALLLAPIATRVLVNAEAIARYRWVFIVASVANWAWWMRPGPGLAYAWCPKLLIRPYQSVRLAKRLQEFSLSPNAQQTFSLLGRPWVWYLLYLSVLGLSIALWWFLGGSRRKNQTRAEAAL